MDQQSTIFDEGFEEPIRRRDLMPKWLKIYMWLIISGGIACFFWAIFFAPAITTKYGTSYQLGALIRKFFPGITIFLMGILVWFEKEWAIRFNRSIAIVWGLSLILSALLFGIPGLKGGILLPILIPYWIGLSRIQQKWEKKAIS